MSSDINLFISVLDEMRSSRKVKAGSTTMEKIAWEVNQYLIPTALSTLSKERIETLYKLTCSHYLRAGQLKAKFDTVSRKMEQAENRPVGGGWL